jgi:hypothetical protein
VKVGRSRAWAPRSPHAANRRCSVRCAELRPPRFRYVHSGDEPHLIAGKRPRRWSCSDEPASTSSSCRSAAAAALREPASPPRHRPGDRGDRRAVRRAPAAYRSWQERRLLGTHGDLAEGLATRVAFELLADRASCSTTSCSCPTTHLRRSARGRTTRNLVEAGAARRSRGAGPARAAAGRRVALICSGGNITRPQLADVLAGA